MLTAAKELLFGKQGGATHREYQRLIARDKFSDFLPWLHYDEACSEYSLMDNSIGHLWEVTPAYFLSQQMVNAYRDLLKITLPEGSVIQFILYPDHALKGLFDEFKANKIRDNDLLQMGVEKRMAWLEDAVNGISNMQGIPLRYFRAYVSIKFYEPVSPETVTTFEQALKSTGSQPVRVGSGQLLQWMRRLFNGPTDLQHDRVSQEIPLRQQVIKAESVIESVNRTTLKIGDWYAKCITPKLTPEKKSLDPVKINQISGGWRGLADDDNQIKSPFIWTLNIVVKKRDADLKRKADITLAQRATGRVASVIQKRVEEFMWATDLMSTEPFYTVIPQMWILGSSQIQVDESVSKACSLWSDNEFEMQVETLLRQTLLITALPFGYYNLRHNTTILDREFYQPVSTIARFLPIQGDFKLPCKPISLMIGRKGEPICFDINDSRAPNQNLLMLASTGSGKSMLTQQLTNDHYAAGDFLRAVDIGYSFERSCKINKGRFIDFSKEKVVMNPFSFKAHQDNNDRIGNRNAAKLILAEMVYSCSGQALTETEWTLLDDAVEWVDQQGRHEDGIDSVCEFLRTYPQYGGENSERFSFAAPVAKEMAFNLRKFGRKGKYGEFFNGKSTFNIDSDEYVVLELDVLKEIKDLFGVVVMQVMNAITQDLYLSDRERRRFVIFEEAAYYLKKQGHKDLSRLGSMIEEGYRRARKYKGSFCVVLQSILDLDSMGPTGKVIFENAAYRFMLQSDTYGEAVDRGLLEYDQFTAGLLKSVKLNKGKYSECFIDSPFGRGVARVAVDKWNYWLLTSDASDKFAYDSLIKKGFSPIDAINQLAGV